MCGEGSESLFGEFSARLPLRDLEARTRKQKKFINSSATLVLRHQCTFGVSNDKGQWF